MKHRITVILTACAAMMLSGPTIARADVDVNFSAGIQINAPSDFYQPLATYGSWVDVPQYGRCFHPAEVAEGWQPYTVGHWEWTDAGWFWVSDEPWGWACCHYGSWYDDPSYGWVWIPGTEWAPAWVDWRYSDDYVGWAPCGPNRMVLSASFFTFCDTHHFEDHFRGRRDFIVDNPTIINRTRVVNSFHRQTINVDGRERTIFANRGPGVEPIRRATGRDFTPRPVGDVFRESHRPENMRANERQQREARPGEARRRETPSPTGREQQRNYQQPNQQPRVNENRNARLSQPQTRDQRPSPTGREQPRNYEQPNQQPRANEHRNAQPPQQAPEQRVRPEHRAPATPQMHEATPPTGRQQPRIYQTPRQEMPNPTRPPEQRREVPTPREHPATPPERTLPPTGREGPPAVHREAPPATHEAPPAVRHVPERPAPTPAPGRMEGRGNDGRNRDGRDGQ